MNREEAVKPLVHVARAMRVYHRHEVVGLDTLPRTGPVLVVVNHSLATYDILMLLHAIYVDAGRLPRPLVDRLFFKVPGINILTETLGAVAGSPDAGKKLLQDGELITVAPGGMREALRPSTQKYQIRWEKRLGFVKLAMAAQSPIVLAACPKADDMYEVYPSHVTAWFYRNYRVPIFFARGLGPTPLPRPVKLVHFLSEPIAPPPEPADEAEKLAVAAAFHARLVVRMNELIAEGVRYPA